MSKPFIVPAPEPETPLGRYRVLSSKAGLHVSPIQLGAMSIGDQWSQYGMGEMNKENSFKLLDAYYDKGGNFIDTANNYQETTSESFIGEWMEQRGIRDRIVLATKYTMNTRMHDDRKKNLVAYGGNNIKSLHINVEESLKRLKTSYIDILYLHYWDWTTPIEEIMNALHHLVASGKVLYLGVSDTPAWVVSKANMYARLLGKTPFVIYQGQWNVLERSFEREIIPMAREEGLALAPWGVLCSGRLRSDEEEERRRQTQENGRTLMVHDWQRTEQESKVSRVLEEIGLEVGTKHLTAVAIAYVMQKTPYVFPIIGGRKVEQLEANLDSLRISLTDEHIKRIESAVPLDLGVPYNLIGTHDSYNPMLSAASFVESRPAVRPIRP